MSAYDTGKAAAGRTTQVKRSSLCLKDCHDTFGCYSLMYVSSAWKGAHGSTKNDI